MEKTFLFGEKNNLVGISSEPHGTVLREGKPFIIILNAGLVHHPGPFRMNKEFSMLLSDNGYASFRFDTSGVGDSKMRVMDNMLAKDRNLSDVGEAIAYVQEKFEPSGIIIIGLCTGADLAHRAAIKYSEVSGAILLDGYGYPTNRFYFKRYAPILISPKRMFNVLYRVVLRVLPVGGKDKCQAESGVEAYYWELPNKQDYIADMGQMFNEGKKHLYVYSSGVSEYYKYENQYADAFSAYPFSSAVTVKHLVYSDHVYTLLEQRNNLFEIMLGWIKKF